MSTHLYQILPSPNDDTYTCRSLGETDPVDFWADAAGLTVDDVTADVHGLIHGEPENVVVYRIGNDSVLWGLVEAVSA